MKQILKNILSLVAVVLLANLLANFLGDSYLKLFPKETAGSFVGGVTLIGLPLAYIFFLTLLFTAFGGVKKYWWIGILLIPAAAFELYFDLAHIYFPVALGLLGWGIGFGIAKLTKKR